MQKQTVGLRSIRPAPSTAHARPPMKGGVISGTIAHRLISERPLKSLRTARNASGTPQPSAIRAAQIATSTELRNTRKSSGFANNAT